VAQGWGCCDIHAHEFDEFLKIPPCATGRHSAFEE
jgi:disease resistance protein